MGWKTKIERQGRIAAMTKIRLYGKLAKFIGKRVFTADISSVGEAVRFLIANFPSVEKHMIDHDYKVFVGDINIGEEEVSLPCGIAEIKIIPVIQGAGAVGRIIGGAVLIGLAFIPGLQILGAIGASLFLGGISQLLTPVPRLSKSSTDPGDPRKNYSFSSIQNTSRQGSPVPIVYGEALVGSVVISIGVDLDQVNA
jgi:hypothetical protein